MVSVWLIFASFLIYLYIFFFQQSIHYYNIFKCRNIFKTILSVLCLIDFLHPLREEKVLEDLCIQLDIDTFGNSFAKKRTSIQPFLLNHWNNSGADITPASISMLPSCHHSPRLTAAIPNIQWNSLLNVLHSASKSFSAKQFTKG